MYSSSFFVGRPLRRRIIVKVVGSPDGTDSICIRRMVRFVGGIRSKEQNCVPEFMPAIIAMSPKLIHYKASHR